MVVDLMITAFVMGLFGSLHCIGMCGGIVGTLSMSLSTQTLPKPAPLWLYILNYNIGRIFSYVLAGVFIGVIAQVTLGLLPDPHWYGMKISAIFLILFGLYISQLWMGLSKLEQWANPFWKKIQPLSKNYLPPKTPINALPLGMIWGWLPCGLVYSVLPIAYSTQSIQGATLVMLSFGLATLPMLMLLGHSAQYFKEKLQNKYLRLVMGSLLIVWGLSQLLDLNPLVSHYHSPVMKHSE